MDEKLGTHIVAPKMYHHLNGSLSADNIPLDRLVNVPGIEESYSFSARFV